jgi:hypothetical protein
MISRYDLQEVSEMEAAGIETKKKQLEDVCLTAKRCMHVQPTLAAYSFLEGDTAESAICNFHITSLREVQKHVMCV